VGRVTTMKRFDREVAEAWDRDVALRHRELMSGIDVAYTALIERVYLAIATSLGRSDGLLLDAGCGLGSMSTYLASQGFTVTGVDLSPAAIAYARADYGGTAEFRVASMTKPPLDLLGRFDVVVASMLLHNHACLDDLVFGCRATLRPGGVLVATIADPATYLAKHGIAYAQPSQRFDLPLRHKHCCGTHASVPYFHRSLDRYVHVLRRSGFGGAVIAEPHIRGLPANDVVTFVAAAGPLSRSAPNPGTSTSHARTRLLRRASRIATA
jgi:2-polyprenyl-3-methyl-5-hydroxy-6-metoxy-1,4-benzoquinol methylase